MGVSHTPDNMGVSIKESESAMNIRDLTGTIDSPKTGKAKRIAPDLRNTKAVLNIRYVRINLNFSNLPGSVGKALNYGLWVKTKEF